MIKYVKLEDLKNMTITPFEPIEIKVSLSEHFIHKWIDLFPVLEALGLESQSKKCPDNKDVRFCCLVSHGMEDLLPTIMEQKSISKQEAIELVNDLLWNS